MPPNNKLEGVVQVALAFDQPTYEKGGPSVEEFSSVYFPGSSAQQEVDDDDEASARVTTRARFTYELDRFENHAMLVINNSTNEADTRLTMQSIHTFLPFRFLSYSTIEVGRDSKRVIWQKIDQFFQQDFSNIGTVAVITLSCPDQNSTTERDNCVEEWDVLNYFLSQPYILQGKPKIFISEGHEPASNPAAAGLPSDFLVIQTKHIWHETYRDLRPFDLLCHRLFSEERPRDILETLSELNQDGDLAFPSQQVITYTHTLTKELLLDRNNMGKFTHGDWLTKLSSDPMMFQIAWNLRIQTKADAGEVVDFTSSLQTYSELDFLFNTKYIETEV